MPFLLLDRAGGAYDEASSTCPSNITPILHLAFPCARVESGRELLAVSPPELALETLSLAKNYDAIIMPHAELRPVGQPL